MSKEPVALIHSSQVSHPARVLPSPTAQCCGRTFSLNWELISQAVNLVIDVATLTFLVIKSGQGVVAAAIVFAAKQVCLYIGSRLTALFFPSSTGQNFVPQADSSEEETSTSSECSSDEDISISSTDSSEEDMGCGPEVISSIVVAYGNSLSVISPDDVLSFSGAYSQGTTVFYRNQGYCGIHTSSVDFSTLVSNQNYVEVLKCIWTEEDLDRAIECLEVCAEEKHPILMLELSRTICRKMVLEDQFSAEDYKEACKWFVLGLIHARLDMMCTTCNSLTAFKGLIMAYHPQRIISKSDEKTFFAENEGFKKTLEDLSTELRLEDGPYPSPEWIANYGWAKIFVRPEEDWREIRLSGIQYLNENPLQLW